MEILYLRFLKSWEKGKWGNTKKYEKEAETMRKGEEAGIEYLSLFTHIGEFIYFFL